MPRSASSSVRRSRAIRLAFTHRRPEAAVLGARAVYLFAARLRTPAGPTAKEAAVAKLLATDAAMRVTTDAIRCSAARGTPGLSCRALFPGRPRSPRSSRGEPDPTAGHQSARPGLIVLAAFAREPRVGQRPVRLLDPNLSTTGPSMSWPGRNVAGPGGARRVRGLVRRCGRFAVVAGFVRRWSATTRLSSPCARR